MRGSRCSDSRFAHSYTAAWARDSTGLALASTLRFTSPQAAMVSISDALIAAMVALSSVLITPWNWNACRVVIRSVPLA